MQRKRAYVVPKYKDCDIICGYTLYFTSKCILEAMHVHASQKELTESGSVKLWVKENGDTIVQHRGAANDFELNQIRTYVKNNHARMYKQWRESSPNGYYGNEK
jgi:hypothetical protein